MRYLSLRAVRLCLAVIIAAVPLSCNLLDPAPPAAAPSEPVSPQDPPAATSSQDALRPVSPTPTSTPLVKIPDTPTAESTLPPNGQPEIELRFIDPLTQQECITHFPFEILAGVEQRITGSGVIDCKFEIQQCGEGVCVTYHSTYFMDAGLGGFQREVTESFPDGALEVYLDGTFTMQQYWTDIPPETIMAYTEANPFEVSSSDIIPLMFHYRDGDVQEVGSGAPDSYPWVFTLHLK